MSNIPIINPWFFYWIGMVDWAKGITLFFAISSGICAAVFGIMALIELDLYGRDDKDYKRYIRVVKTLIPVFVLSFLITIFIPTKDTLIYMQTAKLITAENLEWTAESVKQVFDYVVNAISGK